MKRTFDGTINVRDVNSTNVGASVQSIAEAFGSPGDAATVGTLIGILKSIVFELQQVNNNN